MYLFVNVCVICWFVKLRLSPGRIGPGCNAAGIKIFRIIVARAKSVHCLQYQLRPLAAAENTDSRFLRFFVRSVPLFRSLMLTPMQRVLRDVSPNFHLSSIFSNQKSQRYCTKQHPQRTKRLSRLRDHRFQIPGSQMWGEFLAGTSKSNPCRNMQAPLAPTRCSSPTLSLTYRLRAIFERVQFLSQ